MLFNAVVAKALSKAIKANLFFYVSRSAENVIKINGHSSDQITSRLLMSMGLLQRSI